MGIRPAILRLRTAIAEHIRVSRRVNCTPEQVIITGGSQQALYLAGQLLIDPGDPVWVENPGYSAARAAFLAAGAELIPIPVDGKGMRVEVGIESARAARLVYVCPSHQYPVGGTLSLTRRMQLLNWAATTNAWIVEDDYDSEFRYVGHPLAALQSLDQENRVIYIGTFSKVLFPGLRIGYMVVPEPLIDHFSAGKSHARPQFPPNDTDGAGRFCAGGAPQPPYPQDAGSLRPAAGDCGRCDPVRLR